MTALDGSVPVGVIGAGTMGSGIAQVAAAAGHPVLLMDAVDGAAERGRARIGKGLDALVARGKMVRADADALLGRIAVADGVARFGSVGLAIEAVLEEIGVKRDLVARLEAVLPPDAIIATNTSSISITSIARDAARPERVVGMHFFNPAPVMKLVEVVSGVATDRAVADTVAATARSWGKVAVHARSTPGFIVNRVARAYYAEPLRLLEEQVASAATIDALMTEGAGFRMGPFALMDLIGHDVNYAVTRSVFDAYYQEPRFRPSLIQLELVEAGRLGRKTGMGFFDYREGAAAPEAASEAPSPAGPAADFVPGQPGRIGAASVMPTDGRTAADAAVALGGPVIVHDLCPPDARRLGFATSADVSPDDVARFVATLQARGIAAVRLPDWPGLVAMRTIAMLANEAFEAVMQGVADAAGVDDAMRFGVNYPRGPIAWARSIGHARIIGVLDELQVQTGDPRYRASLALRQAAREQSPGEAR